MSRPEKRPLAAQFASDPLGAVLAVLEAADRPLGRRDILDRLTDGGVAATAADRAWSRAQRKLKDHPSVGLQDRRYAWIPAGDRERPPPPDEDARAARQRRDQVDAMRALAELAAEVEELVANEASAAALIHRVRARVARSGLEPVGRAGEDELFDRTRHKPIGGGIRDGSPVVVVRPGYVWRSGAGDVLVAEVLVEE